MGHRVPPRHRRGTGGRFRKDIEGLRAVAVLAVVAYHAHVGFLGGGFVGVDVFFVISGYLITDLLWRELAGSGRLSFASFYARRMRRLLPAAAVVIVVTMVAAAIWMPPLQLRSVWEDGVACALYVGNYRFALQQTDYLNASSATVSPFQHFWSLGVEEQFYLVWPALLVVVSRSWRRVPSRGRAAAGLAVVVAGSSGLSMWLTTANEPWAFFSLPTRAWELGIGGLIALGAPELRRIPAGAAAILGWAGLGAICWSAVAFSSSTVFPGTAALAPVLGTAGVVAAGLASPVYGPVLVLGRLVMTAIGRISYSWYLWHWPVLIIAPYALGPLREWEYVGLALGSGVLAVASYHLVEQPARSSRWLAARPVRSLATGASLSVAAVCACALCFAALPPVAGHGRAPVAAIHVATPRPSPPSTRPRPSAPSPTPSPTTTTPEQGTLAALHRQLDGEEAQVEASVARSVGVEAVPANLQPPLVDASASEGAPMVDGCLLGYTTVAQPPCQFGDTAATSGAQTMVLFGDSHAAMWYPAVDTYADAHHLRLDVWTKATCPPVDLSMVSPVLGRQFTECDQWRNQVLAQIATLHPSLVVLGTAPNYDSAYDIVQDGPAWMAGLTQIIHTIRSDGAQVVVLGPVPSPDQDIPDCVSAHLDDVSACNVGSGMARDGIGLVGYDTAGLAREATVVAQAGGLFVDVRPWFCAAATCPVIVDNVLVFRDNSHITVPYATYLAPLVDDELSQAVTARAR